MKIYDEHVFDIHNRKKIFTHSMYFGGLFLIVIASLILGFLLSRRLLFSYALYSFSIWLLLFTDLGYAFEFIYPNTTGLNSAVRVPLSMVVIMSFMFFTNQFLEIRKHKNSLTNFFTIFSALWIINYLLSLPFMWINTSAYHSYILVSNYIFITLSFFLMIFSVIITFRFQKQKALTYIFAIIILIAGVVFFYIAQFGISKSNIIYIHPFMLASVGELSVFSLALFFDIRRVNSERNTLMLKTAIQEQEILTAQIKGNEQASKHISRELHDSIGSQLALIKNKMLSSKNNNKEISEDISKIYRDVRDISHRLSSNNFFMVGCKNAVKEYLDGVNKNNSAGIKCSFYCDAKEVNIEQETSLQVFRIIQEAVHNCIKHAGKSQVQVQIINFESFLSITIEDDGKGFDTNNLTQTKGIGLQNIEMRTKLLNGNFTIASTPGKGTFITIKIPV